MVRLKVFRVEQVCFFELAWGNGQQLTAQLAYPQTLTQLYETWQQSYLDFYRSIDASSIRGRVKSSGTLSAAPVDYRAQLVAAEAAFLAEFYDWLKSRELLDVRSQIAKIAQEIGPGESSQTQVLNLFLTCEPLSLARFPWETWEILGEFGRRSELRIIRTPANLRHSPAVKVRSGRMRILVILGDETGLSFKAETEALKSLERIAEVVFEGWRVGEPTAGLKERIANRLTEPDGWDILFFAGHSNESILTGGELAIAPQTSIFLNEIKTQLLTAKDQGLQFAIFNSCKGLDLANTLIDLGLSQVAIMREPIHNAVAQEFLLQFIQSLARSQGELPTVQDALLDACEYLKLDRNLTYPSSYFVPSFFCHPETLPFTPRTIGFTQKLKRFLPTTKQAIALGLLTAASLITPLQDLLLDGRLYTQSVYRQITNQIPTERSQIHIVQIDEASLRGGLIPARQINPIDRTALAKITDRLLQFKPKVLAIDYLLDRPMPEDQQLAKTIERGASNGIPIIFAADLQNQRELSVSSGISKLDTAMQGHVYFHPNYLTSADCRIELCSFSFLTAFASEAIHRSPFKKPSKNSGAHPVINQRSQLLSNNHQVLQNLQPKGLPKIANQPPGQSFHLGMETLVDYSIPPDLIYKTSSAIDILQPNQFLNDPILILAAGDYAEAGVNAESRDKFAIPAAVTHWRSVKKLSPSSSITGAEIHAYMIHQYLNQRYLVGIPMWMMMIPAAGLGLILLGQSQNSSRSVPKSIRWKIIRNFLIGSGIYGLGTLQLAITAGILLPWLFPMVTIALFQFPRLKASHSVLS